MKCRKCGSDNTRVQLINFQKRRSMFTTILWIILGFCSCGLLLIPLLRGRKNVTKEYMLCNNCGHKEEI